MRNCGDLSIAAASAGSPVSRRCTNRPALCTNGGVAARIASGSLTHRESHGPGSKEKRYLLSEMSRSSNESGLRRRADLRRCDAVPAASGQARLDPRQSCDPGFERADTASAHGNGVTMNGRHLHQFVVPRALVADDPIEVDDVAAVNADKAVLVEPRFHVADGEWTEQLVVAIEDVGVMGVGVDRDHLVHGEKMRGPVALDRQVAGEAP